MMTDRQRNILDIVTIVALVLMAVCVVWIMASREAHGEDVVPVGQRAPVSIEPAAPYDSFVVYRPDGECAGTPVGYTLPSPAAAICYRDAATEYLIREVGAKRVVPGPKFTSCDWAWGEGRGWAGCVEGKMRATQPEIRFAMSAVYLTGLRAGVVWTGCQAGVAYPDYVRVSLGEPYRILPLVAWETSNSYLGYLLDLYSTTDGPVTRAATDYAIAACPAY